MLELFKYLSNQKKIVIKKIEGVKQTYRDLCDYMVVAAAALNQDVSLDDLQKLYFDNYSIFIFIFCACQPLRKDDHNYIMLI